MSEKRKALEPEIHGFGNEESNKRSRPHRQCRLRAPPPPVVKRTPKLKGDKKQAKGPVRQNLPDAVRAGDLQLTKDILTTRKHIVKKSLNKPLLVAIKHGFSDIVKLLLKYGADACFKSALNLAIQAKNEKIVQSLLEHGANPNAPCRLNGGGTAFHAVASHLHHDIRLAKKIIKKLVKSECNIEQVDNLGRCPFAVACELTETDLMSLFLLYGANVNQPSKATQVVAFRPGKKYTTAIHTTGFTPLHRVVQSHSIYALQQPSTTKMKFLLDNGADVHAKDSLGYTPLMRCCQIRQRKNVEYCKILLQYGSDPNALSNDGACPLFLALSNSKEVVQTLLDAGAHGNAVYKGSGCPITPLQCAIDKNYPDDTHEILIGRTDLEHINMRGQTRLEAALHMVINKGLGDRVVSKLLEAGADPNISNRLGMTPLALAAEKGCLSTVKTLLFAGASSNPPNMASGSTTPSATWAIQELAPIQEPVCCAAAFGHTNIMNVLFSAGFGISESAKTEKLPHLQKEALAVAKAHLTKVKPLMELCRITVWKACSPLSEHIENLGLPKAMKLFISLEDYVK